MELSNGVTDEVAQHCDIFCQVIDNYGDIGVSWRLARQLTVEYKRHVRLWLNDLTSLAKLCPEVNVALEKQYCRAVEVRCWTDDFVNVKPAELVIEAFGCVLPESYVEAMAIQIIQPVWLNLEYLSAESWIENYHRLPSPHPRLPLTKYFFFPGFTSRTGGLLLEQELLAKRDSFQLDLVQQQVFWQSVGMTSPASGMIIVSLFGYENEGIGELFDVWVTGSEKILCLIPESRILSGLAEYFDEPVLSVNHDYICGHLHVRVLPFLEQEQYDFLLWACDINFVRGEDSYVRAQWAGRPFVWHIYPQHDDIHWQKLQDFLTLYGEQLSDTAQSAVQNFWYAWNQGSDAGRSWMAFEKVYNELKQFGSMWAKRLAENNLALNLLDFQREIGKIRALKIEEYKT